MPPASGFLVGGDATLCVASHGRVGLRWDAGAGFGREGAVVRGHDVCADSQPAQLYRPGEKLLDFGNMNVVYSHQSGWGFAGFAELSGYGRQLVEAGSKAADGEAA
jgi:hypothetical protein